MPEYGLGRMSELEAIDECVRRFTVEIPWQAVRSERERLVRGVAGRTVVPGFRKGKAPPSVLYRYFESEIRGYLLEGIIEKALFDAIRDREWRVAHGPMVNDFRIVDGRPLVLNARIEVFPEFELGDYRNLKIAYPATSVTEQMVGEQIEQLRHRNASYRNLDPRPIRDGDLVNVLIEGTSGGRNPEIEPQESRFVVGNESTLPEFTEALRGMSPGDWTEFDATYPDDHQVENLAGKTLHVQVEVQGILEVELPDLDDEFAKDVDNRLDSFEALRNNVRQNIELHLHQYVVEAVRREAMRQLAAMHPMPLPRLYLDGRVKAAQKDRADSNAEEIDPAVLTAMVENRVRADLVLHKIADEEGIEVSDEDTEKAIQEFAQSNQLTVDTARKQLEEKGMVVAWRLEQLRNRALQLVIDEADKVAIVPKVPPQPENQAAVDAAV